MGTKPLWLAKVNINQTLQSASYHYLITDHLGTPQLAINGQGQQTWKMYSDAFGNTALDPNNQMTLNLRFPGQYYDQETGLSYNYQRDYNPKIGRYLQSDPLGLNGGINNFTYVENNPLKYVDFSGELVWVYPAVAYSARTIIACSRNNICRNAAIDTGRYISNTAERFYTYTLDLLYEYNLLKEDHPEEARLMRDKYWEDPYFDDCERLEHDMIYMGYRVYDRAKDLIAFAKKEEGMNKGHKGRYDDVSETLRSMVNRALEKDVTFPKL